MFNININHCSNVYITENQEKHNKSPLAIYESNCGNLMTDSPSLGENENTWVRHS